MYKELSTNGQKKSKVSQRTRNIKRTQKHFDWGGVGKEEEQGLETRFRTSSNGRETALRSYVKWKEKGSWRTGGYLKKERKNSPL